jgi:hypothetical protein
MDAWQRPGRGLGGGHWCPEVARQACDASQPTIGTRARRQQRLRKARLPDPTLTHPRLAVLITKRSESAITRSDKAFRRGLRGGAAYDTVRG